MIDAGIVGRLRAAGLVGRAEPKCTPLAGGVSSDIHLVEAEGRVFVVKRALEKLRVEADWYADPCRNDAERAFIEYVAAFRPDAVPAILHADAGAGFFAMEYFGGFANWKTEMLAGRFDPAIAGMAGNLLGEVHARSWCDAGARARFATGRNFEELRVGPYLRAAAASHPDIAAAIHAEAARLLDTAEALVHGDFSPKNMLFRGGRLVLLDCEVAWFGDPAFDVAFLINHLCIKALHLAPKATPLAGMIRGFRAAYAAALPDHRAGIESRVARLLPMLMLARVDGKSPVEYLDPPARSRLRDFARARIAGPAGSLDGLVDEYFRCLPSSP